MLLRGSEISLPLLEAKRSLTVSRCWLPWGFSQQLRIEIALSFPGALALLADKFIQLLPQSLWSEAQETENLKGRDRTRLLEGGPLSSRPFDQELLWCAGQIATQVENGKVLEREACSCLVTSSFKEFRGNTAIAFGRKISSSGPLQALEETFIAQNFARILPIQLEKFRLGIERFSARRSSSLLGLSPQVDQTLTIEADSTRLVLEVVHQGLKRATDTPFYGDALWQGLQGILSECCVMRDG